MAVDTGKYALVSTLVDRLDRLELTTGLRWLVRGLEVSLLLVFSNALLFLLRRGDPVAETTAEGEPLLRLFWVGVFLLVLLLAAARPLEIWRTLARDRLLILLILLVPLSALWSYDPALTLRRSGALAMTSLFGIYLASKYREKQQLRLLAWALGIAAVLSLIAGLALPEIGIDGGKHAGDWRGVFHHKNFLGRLMTLGALTFFLVLWRQRSHLICALGLGLSFLLVALSGSMSAYAATFILISAFPVLAALRWHRSLLFPAIVLALLLGSAAGLFAVANFSEIMELTGRDATLTGRTRIWQALAEGPMTDRPWLGYGYGGFWLDWEGPSYEVLQWFPRWQPKHAHNGYIDIVLQLGLVGLAVFLAQLVRATVRAIRFVLRDRSVSAYWPLAFLLFVLVYNLPETVILERNNLYWVLYVMVSMSLGRIRPRGGTEEIRHGAI